MPAPYSDDLRQKAIAAVKRGERKTDVSRLFNISHNTLDLWLKREAKEGYLLLNLAAETVLADKAYDADERVIEPLQSQSKIVVVLPHRNRLSQLEYDKHLYKARHLPHEFLCQTQAVSSHCQSLR